jgi:hypothetical protein
VIPLRPLSITEMLDGAFTAMKWNPKTILGASAAVAIVVNVMTAVAQYLIVRSAQPMVTNSASGAVSFNGHTVVLVVALVFLTAGVTVLGHTILTGLLTVTVGQAVLGRKETLDSAWRATRGKFWRLLGMLFLLGLFLVGGWAVAMGVVVGAAVAIAAGAHLTGVGVLVGVVGGGAVTVFAVITYVRWSVAVPVIMLESSGPLASLGRSWRLVRRSSWRVWWALVLAELIIGIAGGIIKIPFSVAGGGVGGVGTFALTSQSHASALGLALAAVGGILASTLTAPLLAGIIVLLYTDLLMRREGFDIKLQAAAASGGPGFVGGPGTGGAAHATWAGQAGPGGAADATWAGQAGPGGQPVQPGWNTPAAGTGSGAGAPGQPGWGAPASGPGTSPGQRGQPGWNTTPTPPTPPTSPSGPGGTGWEDTVGWPQPPGPAGGPGPVDGGSGPGGPDPNAW